jgi:hypothetical protein
MKQVLLLCLLVCGCSNKQQTTDKPAVKVIQNDYTKIVQSLCSQQGEIVYTDNNTNYLSLSETNDLNCFVFASDVVCGGAGGSCGRNIEVYFKKINSYQITYQNCGFNVSPCIDQKDGIKSFRFSTREGYDLKVSYINNAFIEDTISVNGLDYALARTLSEVLGVQSIAFTNGEQASPDADLKVWQEPFKLSDNKIVNLVTVNTPGTDYFLVDAGRILMHVSDIYSFEVASNPTGPYPALKVYNYQHIKQTKDTSFFEGSVYRYNKQKKCYLHAE